MKLVPATRNRNSNPFEMMDRFFNNWTPSLFRQNKDDDFWAPFNMDMNSGFTFGPSVDVEETEKDYVVRAELPGMEKDEFSIDIENNVLTLQGEKKHREEHKDKNYHRVECSYGSFHRRIALPSEIIADKADAKYDKGVLTVTVR
jgi:HSP20 family protein